MTERRGDQGFSMAPQRLGETGGGPRRSRLRGIGLAAILVSAAAIVTIAWIGPRLTDRPSFEISFFATPVPSVTPSPTPTVGPVLGDSLATPLPAITRPDGPLPTGRIAIQTDAFRVLDLATGAVVTGPRAIYGRDALFRAPTGDGWTCICFDDGELTGATGRAMDLVEIGPTGELTRSTTIATFKMTTSTFTGQADLATDVDIFDGRHRGLLAIATHDGKLWRFAVAPLDVDGRQLGASVDLGNAIGPAAEPSPNTLPTPGPQDLYLDGPHVRVAPGGHVAFVWGVLQQSGTDGLPISTIHAWRVALGADGSIGEVTEAPGLLSLPLFCSTIGFASSDRLAWLCPIFDPVSGSNGGWKLGTVDLDGRAAGQTELTVGSESYFEPLFDRANGQIYVWDPGQLSIARIDAYTLVVERATFEPLVQSSSGLPPGGGSAPVDWHHGNSAILYSSGLLAGAADGGRLYAVGLDPASTVDSGAQPSRGIFVIDRATLALVDRWAPATEYVAVTALPGGLVAAAGIPGVKEDGHFAPWEASLTIHDAADGRILVRFGQLGNDLPPIVVDR
ncbi:MAG TPA: hypothetical protein VHM48_00275 [Candidatus Limnocylindrales bacterium]|nr:hypothetical protein [Candidatus Limnocylindrales bacterium]